MKLTYNSFRLDELGDLSISQQHEFETGDPAQRAKVTLRVRIDTFEPNHHDNRALLMAAREALQTQYATLKWEDDDAGKVWIDQTASVQSLDLPEDPSGWGAWQQAATIVFVYYEHPPTTTDYLKATFLSVVAGSTAVNLGDILLFNERYAARRFNDLRDQRSAMTGQIALSGIWKAPPTSSLADARNQLFAQHAALLAAVDAKSGTLTYKGSTYVVRVEDFNATINQALYSIEWTMTVGFTRFPDESAYSMAEYSAASRDDWENGDQTLSFSGRVMANSELAARTRLKDLRAVILAAYVYTEPQQLRAEATAQTVDGGVDGDAFTELSFSEEYRKRKGDVLSWTLRVSERTDNKTGTILTNYSGTVTASGVNAGNAYDRARAQAVKLGYDDVLTAGKGAFPISSSITWDQRRVQENGTAPSPVSAHYNGRGSSTDQRSPIEFVRLEFSYDYQDRLAGRRYVEINTEIARETFGLDTESVSGFVIADTFAVGDMAYTEVKAPYLAAHRLILNERTTKHTEKMQHLNNLGVWTTDAAVTDVDGVAHVGGLQQTRLDFSFQVHLPKAAGSNAIRYASNVSRNFLDLEKRTTFSGSVYSDSRASADTFLDAILAGLMANKGEGTNANPTGVPHAIESSRNEDRDFAPYITGLGSPPDGLLGTGSNYPRASALPGPGDSPIVPYGTFFMKLDFSETFSENITGDDAILTCELTQAIEYSGTRWVAAPIPKNSLTGAGGITIMQDCGVQQGRRSVRGNVVSASFETAMAWCKKQRFLRTGDFDGGTYAEPENIEVTYVFPPHQEGRRGTDPDAPDFAEDGGFADGSSNVRCFRLSFSFSEILPNYLMPGGTKLTPMASAGATISGPPPPPPAPAGIYNADDGLYYVPELHTGSGGDIVVTWVPA